ncbi:RsmD family RNA methyltransferase [Caldivirga maquilingensis]|uniref:Methyltransferase-like protein n=1 Tax=Caldivirga maquilingensis (strain ATCC 700844 / DSM 13496 / JCM 10307 / IC-167) TaxID=397948 RepID=A8MDD1_CALMQ|nr:RsmD family RNA methyltransferase [Caldivirga maquilingensis]ABW01787.1 methyltransferase-like protein [Caldivirga maquilingensis IC-167]
MRIISFKPKSETTYTYWDINEESLVMKYRQEQCKPLFTRSGESLIRLYIESNGHSYKLCSSNKGWAPTLVIDGIVMHTMMSDPLSYSYVKLRGVRVRGIVLDCCTGLGYTTLVALRKGARRVVTVEADDNVIELARYNPWSSHLMDPRVDLVLGDIYEAAEWIRDSVFDLIIHDPPRPTKRFTTLYSEELYRIYSRLLKRGGLLYHYVPMTGIKYRGRSVKRGVIERLRRAGFTIISENEYGLLARRVG